MSASERGGPSLPDVPAAAAFTKERGSTWSADIVTDAAGFAALEGDWNALAAGLPTPLVSFDWFDACRLAIRGTVELRVVVVRRGGAVEAIAPLMIDRTAAIPVTRPLDDLTHEVNAFVCRDPAALEAVCRKALALRWPLTLRRIRSDSPELTCLRRLASRRGAVFVRPVKPLASVPLDGGWEAVEAAMSASSRTFMRRKLKIAERSGAVRLDAVSPDTATVDSHLDELFRVEAAGWKGAAGTALQADTRMGAFIAGYGRAAARSGTLRMFYLKIGDETAAVRMTVEHGRRLWELKIGYDERFSQCSPGILLMNLTLRHACEAGLAAYEFLGAHESWHGHWPNVITPCSSFRFYPTSIAGALGIAVDASGVALQRVKARLAG